MIHNPNCDGSHCSRPTGEVRVLPTGGDSNAILCSSCFAHEITYRKLYNRHLAPDAQFKLPKWEECKVYGGVK